MKKNVMMRVASLLMVCVLATTCGISGTFAKYTTAGTVEDVARVAKFGVKITGASAADNTLFKKQYEDTSAGVTVDASEDAVAPGTTSQLTHFAVTGSPEVDVTVTFANPVVDLGSAWVDGDGKFYCPIVFTVSTNAGTSTVNGLDFGNVEDCEDAIKALIVGAAGYYEANTDLSTINDDLSISWAWAFTGGTGSHNVQTDVKDTFLGDEAADGNAATISISVTCTVEQVD